MIKYGTFLFWTLNQTRLTQFCPFHSHKYLMFILNIETTVDWNMLAKPIWVVVKEGNEPINDWIQINGWRMMVRTLNKQCLHWLFNDHWMECVDSMLKSLLLELVDTNNENGRHIYEWNQINQANKQYSKLIRTVHNGMTQIACILKVWNM